MFKRWSLYNCTVAVVVFYLNHDDNFDCFRQQIRHWTRQRCQQIKYAIFAKIS